MVAIVCVHVEVASGSRHEFLLENEDSGTDFYYCWCCCCRFVFASLFKNAPSCPLHIQSVDDIMKENNLLFCSFHAVFVMASPADNLLPYRSGSLVYLRETENKQIVYHVNVSTS